MQRFPLSALDRQIITLRRSFQSNHKKPLHKPRATTGIKKNRTQRSVVRRLRKESPVDLPAKSPANRVNRIAEARQLRRSAVEYIRSGKKLSFSRDTAEESSSRWGCLAFGGSRRQLSVLPWNTGKIVSNGKGREKGRLMGEIEENGRIEL